MINDPNVLLGKLIGLLVNKEIIDPVELENLFEADLSEIGSLVEDKIEVV